MSHFVLFHWIMMQIFIAHTASEDVVRGVIGKPVQLPCFYQVTQHKGISDMCWGRGPCPNSKCNNKILHTTGNRVTFRKSQRYSLQGYISYGDVSLTIGRVKAEDAGTYCCRVEIPGWFNDIKRNMRLEVVRAPPVITTTTRRAPISTRRFRKTTFAPQTTSDHQTTAESTVVLTDTISESTIATTNHTTAETAVLLTTTVPPATKTSALPDFTTGFQEVDMRTEDDVMCSTESVSLPEGTEVTTEFPSMIPTAEGTKSADTSPVAEDVPTAATTFPAPTLWTQKSTLAPSGTESKEQCFSLPSSLFQFPSYAILIACLAVVPVLLTMMLLLWKRKHTKKFIIKSLRPAEDLEKVFSGADRENSIFDL
ncbi:TIMD4 protein, partial [Zapornia atra]|nr:TIMD4 protein [Zapornia atra]